MSAHTTTRQMCIERNSFNGTIHRRINLSAVVVLSFAKLSQSGGGAAMSENVSLFRLYLMRFIYLADFVVLGLSVWPGLIRHQGL